MAVSVFILLPNLILEDWKIYCPLYPLVCYPFHNSLPSESYDPRNFEKSCLIISSSPALDSCLQKLYQFQIVSGDVNNIMGKRVNLFSIVERAWRNTRSRIERYFLACATTAREYRAQRYISGSVRSGVESFAQAHVTVVLFACVIVDIPVRECLCRLVAGFSDHV